MSRFAGIRFTLKPSGEQKEFLKRILGAQRFLWNYFLNRNILHHMFTGKFVFYNEMAKCLPILKEKLPWLAEIPSQTLQQTLRDLDKALKACFRSGSGFPKFKSRNNSGDSAKFPQGFRLDRNRLYLPKIGWLKIFRKNFPETGKIHNVTVKLDRLKNRFIVSICHERETVPFPLTGKTIGLDAGSVRLYTDSNGNFIDALRNFPRVRYFLRRIVRTQKKLSPFITRIKNGDDSARKIFRKLKKDLGILHRKLFNYVHDILHKLSRHLVEENDLIVVEDLSLRNMSRSASGTAENPGKNVKQKSGLNRNLLSNRISMFFEMLHYKTEWFGKRFLRIDPRHTSQKCSRCGYTDKTNRLSQPEFRCGSCGFELNADHNAALNILHAGLWTGSV